MRGIILNLILLMFLISPSSTAPDEAMGVVTYVESGDTFEVWIEKFDPRIEESYEVVRLADVDSPGSNTAEGRAAKEFTEAMLLKKHVWLDIDNKSEDGRGPYGRLICVVYQKMPNGSINNESFNKMLVDAGHATVRDFETNEFDPVDWWSVSDLGIPLVINEVELNPEGDDRGGEWIELYNRGDEDIDMGNWTLSSAHGLNLTLPEEAMIRAGGFYVVTIEDGRLYNTDEVIFLRTDAGPVVDRTISLDDTKNDDRTWARCPDGGVTWVYVFSSKNATATCDVIYSASSRDKNWLRCCAGGYTHMDPLDRQLWNITKFLE